jgi:hypothetical protein
MEQPIVLQKTACGFEESVGVDMECDMLST